MEPDAEKVKHEAPTSNPQPTTTHYRRGIELFNAGEYFEAHEVWEELWMECPSAERRFVQALIQAAVAIYHFGRKNYTGASRLFHSGRRYMKPYAPVYMGLDVNAFWQTMEEHLAPALVGGSSGPRPAIVLAHAGSS